MIQIYINKLIENLPAHITNTKQPLKIDIVLDGGAFNGSYLVGALYFLKEMEKRNYIVIDRISGCSIGSLVGFLYYIDRLDLFSLLYNNIISDFKKNSNLKYFTNIKNYIGKTPSNICDILYKKLYITYHNVINGKKVIKKTYKNIDDVFETILKSSFLPLMIDGNLLYKNKFMDGQTPYIFNISKGKKILFLNLLTFDKLTSCLNIKNENNNFHRVLSGLLEIHNFFIKGSETNMCSYVNDWGIGYNIYIMIRYLIEKIIVFIIYFIYIMNKTNNKNITYIICSKFMKSIISILINRYCF